MLAHPPLRSLFRSLLVLVCLTVPFLAQPASAYFIRPFITFGPGQTTDGLIVDGATSSGVQFNDAARSARSFVDLETGEMALYAEGSGSTVSSSGQGVMGDTLNFQNGMGTEVFFGFELEALIDVEVLADTPGRNSFVSWFVAIAVFEAGLVDHTNFFGNAQQDDPEDIAPLFYAEDGGDFNNPSEDIFGADVFASVDGSILLESNNETVDVFYLARLSGISNEELNFYLLDGENTAAAFVDVDPGVEVGSGSGVFLGFPHIVPEPGPAALLAGAWLLAFGLGRRGGR